MYIVAAEHLQGVSTKEISTRRFPRKVFPRKVFPRKELPMKELKDYVLTIPDFPEPGVMFRDITSVLQ